MRKIDSLTALSNALSPPRARFGSWRSILLLVLLLASWGARARTPLLRDPFGTVRVRGPVSVTALPVLANIEGTTLPYAKGQGATQITLTW